jgi:hypothetical protein
MRVVRQYGTMWARNQANIDKIPSSRRGGKGVYVLFDGSMPMYVGKGNIKHRIFRADTSKHRGPFWDHFSWYAIKSAAMTHDVEVLMLRILPPNLRFLTRQGGDFLEAERIDQDEKQAIRIPRKVARKHGRSRRRRR